MSLNYIKHDRQYPHSPITIRTYEIQTLDRSRSSVIAGDGHIRGMDANLLEEIALRHANHLEEICQQSVDGYGAPYL